MCNNTYMKPDQVNIDEKINKCQGAANGLLDLKTH